MKLKSRILTLGASAVLLTGAGIVIAGPAQAINCSFGDNFYYLVSDSTVHALGVDDRGELIDDGGTMNSVDFCQKDYGYGSGYYALIEKGTSLCIQDNSIVYVETCDGEADQEWALGDNDGNPGLYGTLYGALKNWWTGNYMLDTGSGDIIQTYSPWDDSADLAYYMNGPFR